MHCSVEGRIEEICSEEWRYVAHEAGPNRAATEAKQVARPVCNQVICGAGSKRTATKAKQIARPVHN